MAYWDIGDLTPKGVQCHWLELIVKVDSFGPRCGVRKENNFLRSCNGLH